MNDQPIQPFEEFVIWYKTILRPPPSNEWFMGRYNGKEIMPTFIIGGAICLSIRVFPLEGRVEVVQHTKALPPEWRP
jgi:hypothetical protein